MCLPETEDTTQCREYFYWHVKHCGNHKMLPDISVIVTCYNYGRYLERCLRSLFNQNYSNTFSYEVIIIDDCSTDETPIVCNKFTSKFPNCVYIRNPKNIGLQRSCNTAIGQCSGRYIVRVDADDYVSRHFLFFLKYTLDKSKLYQAVACDYTEVDSFETVLRHVDANKEEIACAVMYRREFLFDVGLYNDEYKYREGHELNKRFKEKYKIGHLIIPMYFVRKHDQNRTKNISIVSKYDKKLKTK